MKWSLWAARYLVALALSMTPATRAAAQVPDHLECYKIRDPLKLAGIVDLNSPQFGRETGCKVSAAKLFCVPASKVVVSAVNKATGTPITPLSFWAPPAPADRICYKMKCPRPTPPDQQVTDQFGTRVLSNLRPSLLCTPAVPGPTPTPDAFHGFPATGQMTCWDTSGTVISCTGAGQDGDTRAGATLTYVDNGDGTITDLNTGLTWEKKSVDGTIHDRDTTYVWSDAFTIFIAGLNTTSFAGHTDWRLPNAKELQSIMNYENTNPSVAPAFNTACLPGCSVLTCSCTKAADHWSATTNANVPINAWRGDFFAGFIRPGDKTGGNFVRAVRGGR